MDDFVRVVKALADQNRLRIVHLLQGRKLCVCELAYVLGITQPSVSKHLKKLIQAGIVQREQASFWSDYFLSGDSVCSAPIIACLKQWFRDSAALKADLVRLKRTDRRKLCSHHKRGGKYYGTE